MVLLEWRLLFDFARQKRTVGPAVATEQARSTPGKPMLAAQ